MVEENNYISESEQSGNEDFEKVDVEFLEQDHHLAVILLSTIDDKGEIDGATNKPNITLDYNKTKGAVDTVDQICASYSTQRITRRWPLAVFFRILDIAEINSQIIFNNTKLLEKTPRRKYLSELSVSLMEDHVKERAKINTLPKHIREFLFQYQVLEEEHNA